MDTVFSQKPSQIFGDKERHVLWSPQGLGADDRAGIFAILQILSDGFKPHIIFTEDEEKGGIGASILAKKKNPFKDLRYIIELDRSGNNDCVFYYCDNKEFIKYIKSFGFEFDYGTYSDICDICPAWNVAGVNLSIGYFHEHSLGEYLRTDILYNTIKKVEDMLQAFMPKTFQFIFGEGDLEYCSPSNFYVTCNCCKKKLTDIEAIPIKRDNRQIVWYCPDCVVDNVHWCGICGEGFEPEDASQIFCDTCEGKLYD